MGEVWVASGGRRAGRPGVVRPHQSVWTVSVPGRSLGRQEAPATHQDVNHSAKRSVGFVRLLSQGQVHRRRRDVLRGHPGGRRGLAGRRAWSIPPGTWPWARAAGSTWRWARTPGSSSSPRRSGASIYASLDPGASAFSPVRNINRKPSEGFSLAADDKGNVTACWLSDKLYANVSHDNGETFAPYVEIDTPLQPVQLLHDECRLRRGRPAGRALPGGDRTTSGTCTSCSGTRTGAR